MVEWCDNGGDDDNDNGRVVVVDDRAVVTVGVVTFVVFLPGNLDVVNDVVLPCGLVVVVEVVEDDECVVYRRSAMIGVVMVVPWLSLFLFLAL